MGYLTSLFFIHSIHSSKLGIYLRNANLASQQDCKQTSTDLYFFLQTLTGLFAMIVLIISDLNKEKVIRVEQGAGAS